jgi:hypothetical protein
MRRWTLLLVLGLLGTVGATACNGDALRPYPQFTIDPRSMTLAAGGTRTVKIVLSGPNKEESWTVESGNTGVASVTQTATGATVAAAGPGTTRMYVVVHTSGFGTVRDSASVTVMP